MIKLIFIIIALVVFPIQSLFALERMGPFPHVIQNPAYLRHISLTPRKADILKKGGMTFGVDSDYSNVFERGGNSTDYVDFDMEIWRIGLNGRYGVGQDFELFFDWPFYHMSGGFLDAFVQDFHNAFGFPNGGRGSVANGLFTYKAVSNGRVAFDYPPVTFLPGNLKVGFANKVLDEGKINPAIIWSFATRLPTSPKNRGVGSSGMDFLFDLTFEKGGKRWGTYFNTGYAIFNRQDWETGLMHSVAWQYSLSGEWMISKWISLIGQMVGGSPELQGIDTDQWNGWPLDLIIGFSGKANSKVGGWKWRVGFAEDITSEGTSVDFTLFASISWTL